MTVSFKDPDKMTESELRVYVDNLEAQLIALGNGIPDDEDLANLRMLFDLTNKEARLVLFMLDGKLRTKESMLALLYAGDINDMPEPKIIDVFVCKARRKLNPYGIRIETIWGMGYRLTGHEILKETLVTAELPPLVDDVLAPPPVDHSHRRKPGEVRDEAIAWLKAKADEHGHVHATAREFSAAVNLRGSGSAMLRSLEEAGYLRVIKRGHGNGKAREWTVEVLVR